MLRNINSKIGVLLMLTIIGSCTKLDETKYLYDTVNSDGFYQTDAELSSAVGAFFGSEWSFSRGEAVLDKPSNALRLASIRMCE